MSQDTPTHPAEATTTRRCFAASAMRRVIGPALGVILLAAAVSSVYLPALRGPFIFDDAGTIVDNPSIRQLWPLVGNSETPGPLNAPRTTAVHGRPLVNVTLAVNYRFGGLDPSGYRAVNLVIHFLSTLLLWAIVARTLRLEFFRGRFDRHAGPLALAAALVWALHPANTETVVYVTQRTELMMGMFYLATLYCSIRYWASQWRGARATWLVLAATACMAGMLSKEMMASAPAMVLLYQRTFVTGSFRQCLRRSWPLYVGLALAWLPVIALNLGGPRTPAAGFGRGVAAHHWWFTQAKVLFLYLKLAIWPWPLTIHYQIPYLKTLADAWPWLLATALLAIGGIVLLRRRSPLGFVAIWFFAVLSPTLVIPLVNEIAAERRMYVPLTALVPLIIVGGYALLPRRRQPFAVCLLASATVAVGFGQLSRQRLAVYQDQLALWQDAAVHQPHDPMVQFNLGTLLAEAGRVPEAIGHLQQAVLLDPDSSLGHFNLARALEESARPVEAAVHYRATLKRQPDNAAAHYNLARLLETGGQTRQAAAHYRQAVAAQPDFPAAHSNLGILLLTSGQTQSAIESFEAALRGRQDLANYINLATAYSMANRLTEAIPLTEHALALARSQGEDAMAQRLEATLAHFRARDAAP